MIRAFAVAALSRAGFSTLDYRRFIPWLTAVFAGILLWNSPPVHAGEKGAAAVTDSPERRHALELFEQFKMAEAVPLLQKLATENPRDAVIWERLGVAMLNYASTLPDPAQSKLARVKAREALLKAQELGANSNLAQVLLDGIPKDGGDVTFSPQKEVNEAMQQAEAAFGRGDLDKAIEGYKRALLLDPKLYEAALFTGDVYFKQHKSSLASEWFDRAVKINPDRETAYRYWGDSLMQEMKMQEARTKFIEAVVAEPYSKSPWVGLSQWAKSNHLTLSQVSVSMDQLALGNDSASGAVRLAYIMSHALWSKEKFKKEFPAESEYRHTSREEVDALHTMVTVLKDLRKKEKIQVDASLSELIRIDEAGLLEPYVFLNRSDKDIAKDYPAYRAAHRDLIRRYLDEFVVPGGK